MIWITDVYDSVNVYNIFNCSILYILVSLWRAPHPIFSWQCQGSMECMHVYMYIQDEHKFFPWLRTFITRKLHGIRTFLFPKCNSTQEVFFTTHQYTSTCAPFVARRTSNGQSISLHVFSNMSSVIVTKPSVILAYKFVISGTGVQNTLSLTYPHKKRSSRGDIRRSWWPGCRTISPNPPVRKCCIQKPTNIWTPVWRCAILLENYPRLKLL